MVFVVLSVVAMVVTEIIVIGLVLTGPGVGSWHICNIFVCRWIVVIYLPIRVVDDDTSNRTAGVRSPKILLLVESGPIGFWQSDLSNDASVRDSSIL
jgi:hypothetical protein